jgi:hypothetical protein
MEVSRIPGEVGDSSIEGFSYDLRSRY